MERVRFSWGLWTVKISPTAKTLLWACQHSHKAAADLGASGRGLGHAQGEAESSGAKGKKGLQSSALGSYWTHFLPCPFLCTALGSRASTSHRQV